MDGFVGIVVYIILDVAVAATGIAAFPGHCRIRVVGVLLGGWGLLAKKLATRTQGQPLGQAKRSNSGLLSVRLTDWTSLSRGRDNALVLAVEFSCRPCDPTRCLSAVSLVVLVCLFLLLTNPSCFRSSPSHLEWSFLYD